MKDRHEVKIPSVLRKEINRAAKLFHAMLCKSLGLE